MHKKSLQTDQKLAQFHKLTLISITDKQIILSLQLIEHIDMPFQHWPHMRVSF